MGYKIVRVPNNPPPVVAVGGCQVHLDIETARLSPCRREEAAGGGGEGNKRTNA